MDNLPNSAAFVASSGMRLRLLLHLTTGPKSPSQLAEIERKHISHVSRALAEMRGYGLVDYWESDSRERYYRVTIHGYAVYSAIARLAK